MSQQERRQSVGKQTVAEPDLAYLYRAAHATDRFSGCDPPEFEIDARGRVVAATFTAYRFVQGTNRCGFTATVRMSDELTLAGRRAGPLARRLPRVWLGERAEAAALRRAFPEPLE